MKADRITKQALLGRTIRFQGNWWSVTGIEDDRILLSANGKKGSLRNDLLQKCTLYPTHDEVQSRYPLLVRALRWAAILTPGEATGALVGHLVNGPFSAVSEAVAHFGGSANAIRQAIRCRHVVRELHARERMKMAA